MLEFCEKTLELFQIFFARRDSESVVQQARGLTRGWRPGSTRCPLSWAPRRIYCGACTRTCGRVGGCWECVLLLLQRALRGVEVHTVTPSRTQLRGLAQILRKISDLFLTVSLWVSWVLLSLGKLVIFLILVKDCSSVILGLFLVVVALESLGLSRRFSSASSFGVSYRRGSSEEISLRIFR